MHFKFTIKGYGPEVTISKGFFRFSFYIGYQKRLPYCIVNYFKAGPDWPLMPKWSLSIFNWKYIAR